MGAVRTAGGVDNVFRALLERAPVLEREAPERRVRVVLGQPVALHEHTLRLRDHLARPQGTQEPDGKVVIGHIRSASFKMADVSKAKIAANSWATCVKAPDVRE